MNYKTDYEYARFKARLEGCVTGVGGPGIFWYLRAFRAICHWFTMRVSDGVLDVVGFVADLRLRTRF